MPKKKNSPTVLNVIQYSQPRLYTGVEWYVGFFAFDPSTQTMRRKKIKLNHISKVIERRKYAKDLIIRLTEQLRRGWNPWIEKENSLAYVKAEDAVEKFLAYQSKLLADDIIREATYIEYCSKIRQLMRYNETLDFPANYVYQMDNHFFDSFLNYIYIDRGNTAKTRDNYLRVMSVFCKFLVRSGYHRTNAVECFEMIGRKKGYQKNRTVIAKEDLIRLRKYLESKNKFYLLACYIEYYCLVRPKEMSLLQIKDISFKKQTLFISGNVSKNRKDGVVTIPNKIIELMLELRIFEYPEDYYLFSEGFEPGKFFRSEKSFRDFWLNHVVKSLKFPREYKFYSLKDSGVTSLIRGNIDPLSVRDQARHSSLSMTDIYTPHDLKNANPEIEDFDSDF